MIPDKDDGTWREGKRFTLFNGKDFSGWLPAMTEKPVGWGVKDGLLVLTGRRGDNNIVTKQKFWNFKLHVEFKPQSRLHAICFAMLFGSSPTPLRTAAALRWLTRGREPLR